jgi:hypothetical protein
MAAVPRTYLYFFVIVALFAAVLAAAWSSLSTRVAVGAVVGLAVGSLIAFRRLRELHLGSPNSRVPNYLSALPEKWHRPMLGEESKHTSRGTSDT